MTIGYPDVNNNGQAFNCNPPGYTGHEGTDISLNGGWDAMDAGVNVYAAASGTVYYVQDGKYDRCTNSSADTQPDCSDPGYRAWVTDPDGGTWWFAGGNVVIILHSGVEGVYATRYDHLKSNSITVSAGQTVSVGQKIGEVGSAGASTGPHLHFEVWYPGFYQSPVDPWAGSCGPNTSLSLWASDPPYAYSDATAPTAAITYSSTSPYKSGDAVTITATFDETMLDNPVPQIAITGSNTVSASDMTKTSSTIYTYSHTVASGDGTATVALSTGTDEAGNVITSAPTSGSTFIVDNTAPTVSAGVDSTTNAQITQDATVSGATSYQWSDVGSTGNVTFATSTAEDTTISASTDGTYTIRLTVTDDAGNSAYDDFTLVLDTIAPAVSAGADKTANTTFTQDATVTGAVSYQWSKQSGTGTITFGPATSEDTTILASADDTYVIRLTVTDAAGNSAYDDFTLVWDATGPTVSSTTPSDGVTDVAVNIAITVLFSETIDSSTMNTSTFTVSDGTGNVSGTVTNNGMSSTFTPSTALTEMTNYIVTINGGSSGVKDFLGNNLLGNHTWNFTTGTKANASQPTTTAMQVGGIYEEGQVQEVGFTCTPPDGYECTATYYTINGTEPDTDSTHYTDNPITINEYTILKFFSVSSNGGSEETKTEIYRFVKT